MSESSLRAEPDAAGLCERCGRREAVAAWAAVSGIGGVASPPATRQVCADCAAELLRAPADVRARFARQARPPRGLLARARWAWRRWRFERAVRREGG